LLRYEQTDGDGDWTSFIDWLQYLNEASYEDFATTLEDRVETDSLLRNMVVESFMLATDNLASGANYYAYELTNGEGKWQIIEFDFDECFNIDVETGEPIDANQNVFKFFAREPTDSNYNPLLSRMLSIDQFNSTYKQYYNLFLSHTFGAESSLQPSTRYASMLDFILPWVDQDKLWSVLAPTPTPTPRYDYNEPRATLSNSNLS